MTVPIRMLDSIPASNRALIFATQRSGSTFLCERLHAQGFGQGNEHILDYVHPADLGLLQSGLYSGETAAQFDL